MGAIPETTTKTNVTLLRLGEGKEVIELSEGATLADLLRITGLNARDCEILVDGRPLEDCSMLQTGMIVSVGIAPGSERGRRTWRDTVGMFRDDPLLDQASEEGRNYRKSLRDEVTSNGDPKEL